MQFSASLPDREADVLYNKGHKERRESFVWTAYFISGCLEITLGQISGTKIHAPWRELTACLFSPLEFTRLQYRRTRAFSSVIYVYFFVSLHSCLFCCFDGAKLRLFSQFAIFFEYLITNPTTSVASVSSIAGGGWSQLVRSWSRRCRGRCRRWCRIWSRCSSEA